jgi:IS30 family transposase
MEYGILVLLLKNSNMAHLTKEQRYTISVLKAQGKKQKEIADIINKSETCISKELRRNKDERSGEYRAELAEKKCKERHRLKPKKKRLTEALKRSVDLLLKEKLSPEQICGRLKLEKKDWVSHETIYTYIWQDKKSKGTLYRHLRSKGKKYCKRGQDKGKRGQIPGRVGIELRPKIVDDKTRIGDLEIDLVIGKDHKGALLTINDRVTKMVKIVLLPSKESKEVEKATIEALKNCLYIKTITSDNGKEFANHQAIAKALHINYYFARPYHSWERGANENTNGLIRQYVPKKLDFRYLTKKYIQFAEDQLNNRPRKTLGYYTPNEVFLHKINQTEEIAFIT